MIVQSPKPTPETAASVVPSPHTYDARTLVDANGVAKILLDDQVYVLRITRLGKLILTK